MAKRGLCSVSDLLFLLPGRYDDRRSLVLIGELEVGRRATFLGEVLTADFVARRGGGRRLFQALVGDETGTVTLKWFRGGEALRGSLRKGRRIRVTGDVRRYRFTLELIHPEIDLLNEEEERAAAAPRVVADYAAPEGIPPRTFRRIVAASVKNYADLTASHLPGPLARQRRRSDLQARWCPRPSSPAPPTVRGQELSECDDRLRSSLTPPARYYARCRATVL